MRLRRNAPERDFDAYARSKGFIPTKRGWPDFLCFHADGSVIAVEVKPRSRYGDLQRLKKDQVSAMRFLESHGINCFVSDGTSLERFDVTQHGKRTT